MKKIIITLFFTFFSLAALNALAQHPGAVKTEEKYDYLENLINLDRFTDPVKRHLKDQKIDLEFFAGTLFGFDNNVNLDPERLKDGFFEGSLNTDVAYNYTPDVRLRIENDLTAITYFTVHNANLLDIYTVGGFEVDVLEDLFTVETDYAIDVSLFPEDQNGSYLGNHVMLFLKHNITRGLYHKAGWHFLHKNYTKGTVRNNGGVDSGMLRRDTRNAGEYETGFYMDKAILKTNIEVFYNDSNYMFFDYYDYWSFRVTPSAIYMFTEKLYASGSFAYQQRRYKGRLSSENNEHVTDQTCSFSASVLYDVTKSFTFAFNCSYRENTSNEPLQKYSGTIMTWGLYYSF